MPEPGWGERTIAVSIALFALLALACFAIDGPLAAAACAALLLLAWFRPLAVLLLLILALPLFGAAPGGPRLRWAEPPLLALLAGFFARHARGRERLPRTPLLAAAAAWAALGAASLLPPRYHPPSWLARDLIDLVRELFEASDTGPWNVLRQGYNTLGAVLLLAVTAALVRRGARIWIERALLLAAGATAAVGLLEWSGAVSLRALRPIHPLYTDRLHATFHHPAWLAQFLLLAAPWALGRLAGPRRGERWLASLTLVLAAVCLLLTLQRGAWVSGVAAALGVLWLERDRLARSPRRVVAGGALALLLLVLGAALVPALRARAGVLFADLSNRSLFWRPVLRMAAERPWLGQGVGSFAWDYPRLEPPGSPDHLVFHGEPHNAYLMALAERGGLGLAALLVLLGAAWHAARRARSPAGLAVAITLLVYGLGQYLFYVRGIELLAFLALGLIEAPEHPRARLRWPLLLGLAALLARLATPAFPPAPQDRSFGFHRPEPAAAGSFEWTARRALRALPDPGAALLEVTLADGRPHAARSAPLEVALSVAGGEPERVRLPPGGVRRVERVVPGSGAGHPVVVRLEPSGCFRPADRAETPDTRLLGVAVSGLRLRRLLAGELLGFHGLEEDEGIFFRWSDGPRATIVVGDTGGKLILPLRAADPAVGSRPARLRVSSPGREDRHLTLADREWHDLEIELPEAPGLTAITIEIDRAWRPRDSGLPDGRQLGFALARWRIRR